MIQKKSALFAVFITMSFTVMAQVCPPVTALHKRCKDFYSHACNWYSDDFADGPYEGFNVENGQDNAAVAFVQAVWGVTNTSQDEGHIICVYRGNQQGFIAMDQVGSFIKDPERNKGSTLWYSQNNTTKRCSSSNQNDCSFVSVPG